MPYSKPPFLSITQFNTLLRYTWDAHEEFCDIWICGEVSNARFFQAGKQWYFSLVENGSQMNCVVFESFLKNIQCTIQNGQQLLVRGSLKFLVKKGCFSFQVVYGKPLGEGLVQASIYQLKEKLRLKGLLDPDAKKPLPIYPQKIGIVSSNHAAGFIDFITILQQKTPFIQLCLAPAILQGDQCAGSITRAIQRLQHTDCDMIVIVRGGGSAEDLMGFNQESVVMAIAGSVIPVLTAIGHEVDMTLSDCVASARATTPTDAAHIITTPFVTLKKKLPEWLHVLHIRTVQHLQVTISHVCHVVDQASHILRKKEADIQTNLSFLCHRVAQCDPLRKLHQGFSIIRHKQSQKAVQSVTDVSSGEYLELTVSDGSFEVKVS